MVTLVIESAFHMHQGGLRICRQILHALKLHTMLYGSGDEILFEFDVNWSNLSSSMLAKFDL